MVLPLSGRLNMATGLSFCTFGEPLLCHYYFHRATVGGKDGSTGEEE